MTFTPIDPFKRHGAFILFSVLVVLIAHLPAGAGRLEIESPAEVRQGEVFTITFRVAGVDAGSSTTLQVTWLGQTVPVPLRQSESGVMQGYALLGVGLGQPAGTKWLKVSMTDKGEDSTVVREVELVESEYPVQRLTLPRKMVHLDTATLERHAREKKQVSAALGTVSARRLWTGVFARPLGGGVSSVFGLKRILNGEPRSPHRGVDFRGAQGTAVRAVNSGRVLLVADHYFAGRCVYVDHGLGVVSMYFHLLRPAVAEGEPVMKGDVIGYVGQSGRSTGPHLHFGLSILGELVDPLPLFDVDLPS